jgi:hypothetical protein
MARKLKGKIVTLAKRNNGEKMTVAELMHRNFDEIFIELDPVKREAMMRNAYTEDCVAIQRLTQTHPTVLGAVQATPMQADK